MVMHSKESAGRAALKYVGSGSVIGLGTGTTVDWFLIALSEAIHEGKLRDVTGVPTSVQTERRSRELGIPLTTLAAAGGLEIVIDGADEISPTLDLIKGLGGALLREKIIAQNAKTMIVIADASKRVNRLGTRSPVPVEVARFEHTAHASFFASLGCTAALRKNADGTEYLTDNGNVIYDCRFPQGIDQPAALADALSKRAGIVESGLFLGLARIALIGNGSDVETLKV